MASLFGDEGLEDILNGNLEEGDQLLSDDENQHDKNKFGEDEDEEENNGGTKPIKVLPKKRVVRNPRPRLTIETLQGRRGIHTIEEYFKNIKFKGKGYEKQNLDEILSRLKHWGHRMYPTYKFDDVVNKIDGLSKKKPLQVFMSRYRLGLVQPTGVNEEITDDIKEDNNADNEPFDEFDALLDEQIAISKLVPHKTANNSRFDASVAYTPMSTSTLTTPCNKFNVMASTPYSEKCSDPKDNDLAQSLPPSPHESEKPSESLTEEQIAQIAENRRLAKQRLQATRLRKQQQQQQQI